MPDELYRWLIEQVNTALFRLWLYGEIGRLPAVGITSRRDIVRALSNSASVTWASLPPDHADARNEAILMNLTEMELQDLELVGRSLREIHQSLTGTLDLSPPDKMERIESLAAGLVNAVRGESSFDAALPTLEALNRLAGVAQRLVSETRVHMSSRMHTFLADFDRAYDAEVLKSIYADMSRGTYSGPGSENADEHRTSSSASSTTRSTA